MNQSTKRILIIGFFILIWIGIIFYGYQKYIKENNIYSNFYENNTYTTSVVKELVVSPETEKIEKKQFHNPEIDDDVLLYVNSQIQNQNFNKELDKNFFEKDTMENCGDFPCFSGKEFVDAYNLKEKKSDLNYSNVSIYDNGGEIDTYLRLFAEKRGYLNRVFAHENNIVDFQDIRTRPIVRDSYLLMRDEMKKENISIHFVSGYRSAEKQKKIFIGKINDIDPKKIPSGVYDEKLIKILNRSALPGYSKHHSGYAVDFGCSADYLVYDFATTKCYTWLSENNFENAKKFGFIPSYPNGVNRQGPDPEPWEFLWVGADYIEHYFSNLDKEKNENL